MNSPKVTIVTAADFPPGKPGVDRAWTGREITNLQRDKQNAEDDMVNCLDNVRYCFENIVRNPRDGKALLGLMRLLPEYADKSDAFDKASSDLTNAVRWMEGRVRQG